MDGSEASVGLTGDYFADNNYLAGAAAWVSGRAAEAGASWPGRSAPGCATPTTRW